MKKTLPQRLDLVEINRQISDTWDNNVLLRAKDLTEHTDHSYTTIIEPWTIREVLDNSSSESNILDIGCGCGYLTNRIYESDRKRITGIDISKNSIKCAAEMYPYIKFIHQDIYELLPRKHYELCTAVMLLNNLPDINLFFFKMKQILVEGGKLVVVIPHPCFWPDRHIDVLDFDYLKEERYKIKFATKGEKNYPSHISYFHRSLEQYLECFRMNGFNVIKFEELPEIKEIEKPDILGLVLQKM